MNKSLIEVEVSGLQICDPGAAALADALLVNKSLRTLKLQGTGVWTPGSLAILDVLAEMKAQPDMTQGACVHSGIHTFEMLHLKSTGATYRGLVKATEKLCASKQLSHYNSLPLGPLLCGTVSSLDLSTRSLSTLGEDGLFMLANTLHSVEYLHSLDLRGVHLSECWRWTPATSFAAKCRKYFCRKSRSMRRVVRRSKKRMERARARVRKTWKREWRRECRGSIYRIPKERRVRSPTRTQARTRTQTRKPRSPSNMRPRPPLQFHHQLLSKLCNNF
mmetsp:Transcript_4595/g.6180  ORF Transcript_4595/g.6180 Transcript_4595/m.6180 type:complete len:276 (+) Transcript_4595:314-1141(+)